MATQHLWLSTTISTHIICPAMQTSTTSHRAKLVQHVHIHFKNTCKSHSTYYVGLKQTIMYLSVHMHGAQQSLRLLLQPKNVSHLGPPTDKKD